MEWLVGVGSILGGDTTAAAACHEHSALPPAGSAGSAGAAGSLSVQCVCTCVCLNDQFHDLLIALMSSPRVRYMQVPLKAAWATWQ